MFLVNTKQYKEAENLAKTQLAYCPNNAIYEFVLGKILYMKGDRYNAQDYIATSLLNCPRLFTVKEMDSFDEKFSITVKKTLLNNISRKPANPVKSARYGYLLYHIGHKAKAKEYLVYAVKQLPNLSTPWLLLGDNKKYQLLMEGAFSMSKSERHDYKDINTLMELFAHMYNDRFQTWYGQHFE